MNLKRVLIAVAVSIPTIAIGERSYRAFKNVAESEKNDPNFRPTKPSKVVADDPSTSLPVPKPPKEFATSRKSSSSDNSIVNDSPSPSSSSSISQHVALQLGAPTLPTSLVVNEAFVTAFDRRTRTACWSCEHLTRARMAATARGESNGSSSGGGGAGSNDEITREKSSFYEPTSEPEQFRPLNSDYMKSGFDRGHLVPAANFKWSQQAMNETFSLTNIAPQVVRCNSGLCVE
jgi:endonuclease G